VSRTYDLSTNVGKTRLRAGDTDLIDPWHEDEELQVFLSDVGENTVLAAALALRSQAASLYDRALRTGTFEEDIKGAVASKLKAAEALVDEVADSAGVPAFDFAQTAWDVYSRRAIYLKEILSQP